MLTVITPPASEPISVAELKDRLRVTHSAEDELISALIPAARARVEAETGLALAVTGFREVFDGAPAEVALARGPRLTVETVAAGSDAAGWTALAAAGFTISADDRPTRITLQPLASPAFGSAPALRIDYTAGFLDCPAPLREAVLALAVEAYERRGDPAPTAAAAEPWLAPFRRGRL